MPSIITSKFRKHNAQQFIEAFSETESDNMYLYIGKVSPWLDESTPPTPVDTTLSTDYLEWDNMISAKRIGQTDVSHVTRRVDWTSGTVYSEYDETSVTLYSQDFYVMNSNFYVYKCISNNGGATSTVEPIGASTSVFETSDGYQWKFMYEVSGAKALKFITPTYIPIQTLDTDDGSSQWDVQQAAVDGSIDFIKVTNTGSAYNQTASGAVTSSANTSSLVISVSGTGASANTAFYEGANLYITGGTAIGEISQIASYSVAGDVATIELTNNLGSQPDGTSTFQITPYVRVTSSYDVNTEMVTYSQITAGVISKVEILNGGQGYRNASASIVVSANAIGAGATGSGATLRPIISPKGGNGFDAVQELGGFSIMMNTRLEYDESGDFTIFNDFRKLGLVKNPLLANNSVATSATFDLGVFMEFTNASTPFNEDAIITGQSSGATARVIDVNNTLGTMRLSETTGDFIVGETITDGTASDTIVSYNYPELQKYTGDVLYVDNRQPIIRGVDQIEDIKLVIDF